MSATISSINYCPVKSISFQAIEKCKIKKNVGIVGDRIFAFSKGLDSNQVKLFQNNSEERRGVDIYSISSGDGYQLQPPRVSERSSAVAYPQQLSFGDGESPH